MLAADVHTRQEQYTRAQIWLRRADQVGGDDPQRKQIVARAFQQVARRNPLSLQLSLTVRPSNNVNNGAETAEIEIGGLPFVLDPSGVELGGYEASTGVSLSYRLSETEKHRTSLVGEVFYRRIWLGDDAKLEAPGVASSDFNYGVLITGVRHQRLIWPELGPSQATGLIGQSWYGDKGLARWVELQFSQSVRQEEGRGLRFGATARSEKRLDNDINSSHSLGFSADATRATENGGNYSFGIAVKNVWSDSATSDHFSTQLRASRRFDDVWGIQPTVRGSIEQRLYTEFTSVVLGRDDLSVNVGVDLVWPEVSYYGFSPRLSVDYRRTNSNVGIYDRNSFSAGLTAVSRF
ncbi:MAG: DUF560 domain-containing protein [Boseongicola sp.]|nr:MAG: DUF560 domain-containing protein [Boseongicola sp.]